jgi:hypothetical protein
MATHAETPLIVPPGKKKGCLLRKSTFGELFAPMQDQETVQPATWDEIRMRISPVLSSRPFVQKILDQDGVGSCATEVVAQAIRTTLRRMGQETVELNPWSIYAHTSGGVDRGSSLDANLDWASTFGCLPTLVWPRSKGWRVKPPQALFDQFGVHFRITEAYDIGSMLETATALTERCTVAFGWQGHACLLTELLDEWTAEYANSWHKSWGDEGFGTIKLRSINYGYGAWAVRSVTVPPASVLEEIKRYHAKWYANAT